MNQVKCGLTGLLLLLLLATTAQAVDLTSNRAHKAIAPRNTPVNSEAVLPVHSAWVNELDEPYGDTLVVGQSDYDLQHNSTVGRMLGWDPTGSEGNGRLHFSYMYRDGGPRGVRYSRVLYDASAVPSLDPATGGLQGTLISTYSGAGYSTLAASVAEPGNRPVPAFHGPDDGTSYYFVWLAIESAFIPGFFDNYVSPPTTIDMDWPKIAMDGNYNIHVAAQDFNSTADVYYQRFSYDDVSGQFSISTTDGDYDFIAEGNGVAHDIAVSPDGNRVVVGLPIQRFKFDPSLEEKSDDCDMLVWESVDGGETFDFSITAAINVTGFDGPDLSQLPDTAGALIDTFRLWIDNNVYIDGDNVLHTAFPVTNYNYFDDTGTVQSRIFYWNEDQGYHVQIANSNFFNNANPGVNSLMGDRPNLYKDPDTGVLWCIYRQFGIPGDTLDTGEAADAGSGGHPNGELFITASPAGAYNGLLWYDAINLTDSRGSTGVLPAGESRNERTPSIALNNDGDYLHISYFMDYDGGTEVQGEGQLTLNDFVYHRVLKQALIDSFEARPFESRYIDSYPMTADSATFWDQTVAVEHEPRSLTPREFRIDEIYPNPFNATTRIAFSLEARGLVSLTVYDVLGRETAVLLDREMNSGRHEVSFLADDLPSGVYFVALESGGARSVRKMALLR